MKREKAVEAFMMNTPPNASYRIPVMVGLASLVLGALTVGYVGWVGDDSVLKVAALPLLLLLAVLLSLDKRRLFIAILLFRAIGDPIFNMARFTVGGIDIGIGAALNALVILIALLFLIERPPMHVAPESRLRLPYWVPLILLIILVSALRAPEPAHALRTTLVIVSYGAVFLIPFFMAQRGDDIRLGINIVLWSSLLPVLYAFVDIAMNWSSGGPEGFRLKSTFSHANIFAFYLLLVMCLLFYTLKGSLARQPAGMKRWLLLGYLFLLLGLLLLTKTRSAWLASLFIFAVYGALFQRRMLIYTAVVPLLVLLIPDVRDRLVDLVATNAYDPYAKLNSFDWRLEIWKAGIGWMTPSHLLFGYGLDAFVYYSPQFFSLAGDGNPGAHNVYVQWFFETGLLGTAGLLWIFYRLLRTLNRHLAVDRGGATVMIALLSAYLVVCASDNIVDYLSFNWYFWFTMGWACRTALARQSARKPAEVPKPVVPRRRGRRAVAIAPSRVVGR